MTSEYQLEQVGYDVQTLNGMSEVTKKWKVGWNLKSVQLLRYKEDMDKSLEGVGLLIR